jgi:hypothetical protein
VLQIFSTVSPMTAPGAQSRSGSLPSATQPLSFVSPASINSDAFPCCSVFWGEVRDEERMFRSRGLEFSIPVTSLVAVPPLPLPKRTPCSLKSAFICFHVVLSLVGIGSVVVMYELLSLKRFDGRTTHFPATCSAKPSIYWPTPTPPVAETGELAVTSYA